VPDGSALAGTLTVTDAPPELNVTVVTAVEVALPEAGVP
jgi:hypothetical protein